MATIDASAASARQWIGDELRIKRGDYGPPEGFTLPPELKLCAVWVRSPRTNGLLGQRWYLQRFGAGGSIDLIGTEELDGSQRTMTEFLEEHGYVEFDPLLYRRGCPLNPERN